MRWAVALLIGASCACGGAREPGPDAGADTGRDAGHDGGPDAACGVDGDGDGIPDHIEGSWDIDDDGVANDEDLDSDGDGISDEVEHAGAGCTRGPDHDEDGQPDAHDRDSDNDGLTDDQEVAAGLSPTTEDTDGDGCIDPAELLLGGCDDPRDAVAITSCEGEPGFAVFRIADDAAPLSEVRVALTVPPDAPPPDRVGIRVQAISVSPAGSATPDGELFRDVSPGARLTFSFAADFGAPEPVVYGLELTDASGTVIDEGRLLILTGDPCPVLI
jgi:hypothetical protein